MKIQMLDQPVSEKISSLSVVISLCHRSSTFRGRSARAPLDILVMLLYPRANVSKLSNPLNVLGLITFSRLWLNLKDCSWGRGENTPPDRWVMPLLTIDRCCRDESPIHICGLTVDIELPCNPSTFSDPSPCHIIRLRSVISLKFNTRISRLGRVLKPPSGRSVMPLPSRSSTFRDSRPSHMLALMLVILLW